VGPARNCEQERRILFNDVLPRLSDTEGDSFAFWSPQEVGEPEFLREVLARLIMYEEYREDSGSRAEDIREAIKTQLEEDREKINSLFTRAYLEGKIYGRNGAELLDLEDIGLLPWENILEKIVFRILDRRFPEHLNIAPFQSHFNSSQLRVLEDKLFKSGEMEIDMAHSTGMIRLIDGYLQPMGLIKKKQRKIQVEIQPDKNPLIRSLFQSLSREKTDIKSLYWQMRKGPLGLTYHQFSILVLALLYSGYLTAYTEQRKISLKNFNSSQLPGVKYIGYGEIIREDCQEILQNCQLIPPRFRNQPFSLPLQQSIWEYLTDLKEEKAPQLENLQYKIGELGKKDMIQPFSRDDLLRHLHQVQNLLEEIKVSYSAEEGLERFATAYRNLPHIEKNLDRADKIADFFDKKFDQYLALRRYLSHPGLQIPPGEKYREIRGLEQGLQESLQDEALIFDPSFFTATWETFRRFKDEYSALYSREHQKELGEERFRPYLEKKESSAYRVLNLLSRIELISVKNDLVKVDRLLNRALAQRCRVFAPENLDQVPVCSCGFALGTGLELPSLQEIQKIMEQGVDEYLEALQAEENAGKISNYIQNMEEAGEKKKARPLQAILQLSLEEQSRLKELDKKLNQEVIDRINKALAGDYSVIQRNLDELYENIVDRSFTPQQLQKIFTEWLEGSEKLPRNTYVQVQGGDSDPPDRDETGIDRFLEQNFPELKPYREELGDSFFLVLAAQQWEEKHGIKVLDLWPEELLQEEHPPTINALQELGNSILKQQQLRGEFTTIIDGILREKSLVESLLNRMELNSIKKIARALVNEELSPLLQEEILIRMIKMAGQETNLGPARQLLEKAEEETDFKREPVELGKCYLELQEGLEALSRSG